MLRALLCLALLAASSAAPAETGCDSDRPLVATREGLVCGTPGRSFGGRAFSAFRGIPYGSAERFERPRRRTAWPGVRDASAHGAICWQYDANVQPTGDEDCLFANVYTPQLPAPEDGQLGRLPVMVFVHGGGFIMGSGNDDFYAPTYLMDEDVVLVTFNYRLGVLGLFNTGTADAPGNYGMLDQVLVLEWVRDNIADFGGDPADVTVFGQSAGGASVSMLVLSPLTKGLFHHAISESGSALAGFVPDRDQLPNTERFGELLNCTGSPAELVSCVKEVSAEVIMEVTLPYTTQDTFFMPREDRESPAPFMPDNPRALLERGEFNLVPWMNGVNGEEGVMFLAQYGADPDLVAGLSAGNLSDWANILRLVTPLWHDNLEDGADPEQEAAKVRDFYTQDGPVSAENLLPAARATADRIFVAAHVEEVRLAAQHAPVYSYLFDHRGPGRLTLAEYYGLSPEEAMKYGPTHGDELCYMFGIQVIPLVSPGSPAHDMVRFMSGLWASFARTGRPSSDVFPMPDWPVLSAENRPYMRLSSTPSLGEGLFQDRGEFWQTVRLHEAWRPENGTHAGREDFKSS